MSLVRSQVSNNIASSPQPALDYAPAAIPAGWHLSRSTKIWLLLYSLILTSVVALAAASMGLLFVYRSDLVMPGVRVSGVDVGIRNTAEATTILLQEHPDPLVALYSEDASWAVPASSLGIQLNAEETIRQAYNQGRSSTRFQGLLQGKWQFHVEPVWIIEPQVAKTALQNLSAQFDRQPKNATIRMRDGQVEVLPPVTGRTLDIAATLNLLTQGLDQIMLDGQLKLVSTPLQPAVVEVSPLLAQVNQLLAHSITIQAYDPIKNQTGNWEIKPAVWASWLSVQSDPADPNQLQWELDQTQLQAYLTAQTEAALDPGRYVDVTALTNEVMVAVTTDAWETRIRVYHHPGQHTVRLGDTLAGIGREYGIPYPWIQQANPDVGDMLQLGQQLIIPSSDEMLPLPMVWDKRIIVNISQQKMWVYEAGTLKWEWQVSTGIQASPTAPGVFQVQTHEPNAYAANWDLWMPRFLGIYRPVPSSDFMNGFHGFPTRGGSQLLWTSDLGRPVTYGCILISQENAAALYEWAEAGTVVEIQP